MREQFIPHSQDILRGQLSRAQRLISEDLLPLGFDTAAALDTSVAQLKKRFPVRFSAYKRLLSYSRQFREAPNEEKEQIEQKLHVLNAVGSLVQKLRSGEDVSLRPMQIEAIEKIHEGLERGQTDFNIELPTGVGKTRIFVKLAEAIRLKGIMPVPKTFLIDQTIREFREVAPDIEVKGIYAHTRRFGKDVDVITYGSLVSRVNRGVLDPNSYKLLFMDESHHSLSALRRAAAKRFEHAYRFGFTATSVYATSKKVEDVLGPHTYRKDIREASEEGALSPFSVLLVRTHADMSKVPLNVSGHDYDNRELEKVINVESGNKAAVEVYQKMFDGQTAVVYCVNINHATRVAEMFNEAGVSAAVIHGNTPSPKRRELLSKYKSGEIKVLCNADLLIEGLDEPRASVCLNLRPTLSIRLAKQRGGRVLRLDPNNPSKHAYIVEFVGENYTGKNLPVLFSEVAEGYVKIPFAAPEFKGVSEGEHGEPLEYSAVPGLEVIYDVEEILRFTIDITSRKFKPVPDGWMHLTDLTRLIGKNYKTTQSWANAYRELYPEWFKQHKGPFKGRVWEYFHPQLVELLANRVSETAPAPEGWMTAGGLSRELRMDHGRIVSTASQYRDGSNSFQLYLSKSGRVALFYSPEVVEKIRTELQAVPKVEAGWCAPNTLAREIHRTGRTVVAKARVLIDQNPEEFFTKEMRAPSGNVVVYYNPALVEALKKEFGAHPEATEEKKRRNTPAPEGWKTMVQLTKILGRERLMISKWIHEFAQQYPDIAVFATYANSRRISVSFVAPEVVKFLEERAQKEPKAPQGWVTQKRIAGTVQDEFFRKLAVQASEETGLEPKLYLDASGQMRIHYPPKIVASIRQKLSERVPAPKGWHPTGHVLRTKQEREVFSRLRGQQEGGYGNYINPSGRNTVYISPQFLALVRTEARSYNQAPEGWRTIHMVALELQRADRTVKVGAERHRKEHPEWFKRYRDAYNREFEHYSPELLEALKRELEGE